jgi:hypothetical protein
MPSIFTGYWTTDGTTITSDNTSSSNNLYLSTDAWYTTAGTTASTLTSQMNDLSEQLRQYQQAIRQTASIWQTWETNWTETTWIATPTPYTPYYDEQAEKKKRAAVAKARKLLVMNLDSDQLKDFKKHRYFLVEGSRGNLYQVRTGRSHNVRQLDLETMKPIRTLCAHPIEAVPDFDTMLAQKLWIESDEAEFVKMANLGNLHGVGTEVEAEAYQEYAQMVEAIIVDEARAQGDTRDAATIIQEVQVRLSNHVALAA